MRQRTVSVSIGPGVKESSPLNNNRGNNRRRGRSNNNRPGGGGGGGQQINRIDSRARGNAPQMLEKFRKLAHDAHLNGDRVQEEYYLQFADHYFRVIADQRNRQEEQRLRRDEREGGEPYREEPEESAEFSAENDYASYDTQPQYQRREERPEPRLREERQQPQREERQPQREARVAEAAPVESEDAGVDRNPFEPEENPFVRENRPSRGLRPRRDDRRPRSGPQDDNGNDDAPVGLDPASLPPAISAGREDADAAAEAKPRRKTVRRRPAADEAGESLASAD